MDINELVGRGTLRETYERIIEDLIEAEKWLDPSIGYLNRPSKAAANAALARVYLSMRQYDKAAEAASAALGYHDVLMDYNTLNASAARPFTGAYLGNNPEIIFNYAMQPYELIASALASVDTTVYKLYAENDLRKTCFFQLRPAGNYTFKGSYSGAAQLFGGLSTDELYVIRAESYARAGQTQLALADLNKLLEKRFKTGTFKPVSSSDDKILDLVLTERRKQLFGRGARWSDLRRLNKEPARLVTLTRHLKDGVLTLPPNHNRYVFPIPDDEIRLSGIQQNPR
jgi:tetratricopeptide (TPR) repeat protein